MAQVSPYDFSYPGGVNSHILQLTWHFEQLGHEVRILAPASDDGRLLGAGRNAIIIGRPIAVPLSGSVVRIARNPRLGGQIAEVLEREQFDVIHIHEPLMPWLPFHTLRLSSCVTVGTFHAASERGNLLYSYGRGILRRWFKKLDGRIAVSPAAAHHVARYFPEHYDIIPNGIDVARYAAEVQPFEHLRDGKLNILFVGRLEKRKGLKYLLRAYAALKRDHPNLRLIIAGEGAVRHGYEVSVRKAGLKDVIFTGYVSEEDKIRYLHTADIFCSPATGNESFGIVLLEAMAAGLPIVATNIRGSQFVVTDGVEGLLVRPKNEAGLTQALGRLIEDPDLRTRLANGGRERVREFDWWKLARRILSYYDRLIYEREAGAREAAASPHSYPPEASIGQAG
ncbi:MAG TPA: glycosyltransferase family 4 protein [Dehalococcoidia bacterium]|nr:glycosyltransferase family 4 protein [Dehalococcoidia bacterium]